MTFYIQTSKPSPRWLRSDSPIVLFKSKAWSGDLILGDKDIPFLQLPRLSEHVHSVTLTFQWHDQGWGYSKGRLWVIKRKRNTPPDPSKHFYGGDVVWEELAPQRKRPKRVTFSTSPDEIYQLWFRVGPGGGHALYVYDGCLDMLVLGDDHICQSVGVIAEQPQEFGPVNVTGLHETIGTVGVDVFDEDDDSLMLSDDDNQNQEDGP